MNERASLAAFWTERYSCLTLLPLWKEFHDGLEYESDATRAVAELQLLRNHLRLQAALEPLGAKIDAFVRAWQRRLLRRQPLRLLLEDLEWSVEELHDRYKRLGCNEATCKRRGRWPALCHRCRLQAGMAKYAQEEPHYRDAARVAMTCRRIYAEWQLAVGTAGNQNV